MRPEMRQSQTMHIGDAAAVFVLGFSMPVLLSRAKIVTRSLS